MKLRKYQVALNNPTKKFLKNSDSIRGQVWAPTGAGKTVCFTDIIKYAVGLGYKNIAVVHPRIALSQDQIERAKKDFGDSIHFTSFHSGKHISRSEVNGEINTTDLDTLKRIIKNSDTVLNKPHLTYSSYHSFGKLVKVKFDLVIFDEAHYLIQPKYIKWLPKLAARKILSYTATPVTRDMMPEQEHLELFGPVIAQVMPYELIKPGYIVAPLVHILHCDTNSSLSENSRVDIIDTVANAFCYQYHEVVTTNGMPYAQMLVAARNVGGDDGVGDIRTVESNIQNLRDKIDKVMSGKILPEDLIIVTVDANGAYINGGRSRDRAQVLTEIKSCGKNVILVHFDTLAEGIDINTLTGCLIMRGLSKSKIIQTIGRCARPYVGDLDKRGNPRSDLYNYDTRLDIRKKPRCIVTVPVIDGDFGNSVDITTISEAFIVAGYGELSDCLAPVSDSLGTGKESLVDINHDKVMSAITNSSLERSLEDMFKLYDEA